MIILLHVGVALLSILYTTLLFFKPARHKFYPAYGLIGFTLASGTYLVVSTHAQVLGACMSGLIYLAGVSVGLAGAHHRLIMQSIK